MKSLNKDWIHWVLVSLAGIISVHCQKEETTNPPEAIAVYNPDVKSLMSDYCITCHSTSSASAGLKLDNYQDVRAAVENGNLISRINDVNQIMPPSGLMAKEERDLIVAWKNAGYPRN